MPNLALSTSSRACTSRPAASSRSFHVMPKSQFRRASVAVAAGKPEPQASSSAPEPQAPETPYTREFRSLGSKVIESNQPFEEPPTKDMWEGDQFEALGTFLDKWFLPGLVVLGIICGSIAAQSYNEDADVFITPATSDDTLPQVIPASALTPAAAPSPQA